MCRSTGSPMRGEVTIRFGTYNIRNGCNSVLESALRGVSQANMDMGIFQETKVTYGIYTCGLDGYSVVATDTPSRHHSGVALFHRLEPHFAVEAVQTFGPNVIYFQMATGERRWYIVGCYLAPRWHLNNRECRCRAQEAPQGRRTVGGGWLLCQTFGAGGRLEGRGYRSGYGNGVNWGYVEALHLAPALMVTGREDVEYDPEGEVGEVPDGINSGYGLPSLW